MLPSGPPCKMRHGAAQPGRRHSWASIIPSSTKPACNSSANCLIDQLPKLRLGHALQRFLAILELGLAPANLCLPPTHLFQSCLARGVVGVAEFLEPLRFPVELPFFARDQSQFRRQSHV